MEIKKATEVAGGGVATAAQLAASYAIEHPELIDEIQTSFNERRAIALAGMDAIPGMKTNRPKGAFYLFPDIRAFGMDSVTFCETLLEEERVVCIPGSAFGQCGEGFIRASYCYSTAHIKEALKRIGEFLEEL